MRVASHVAAALCGLFLLGAPDLSAAELCDPHLALTRYARQLFLDLLGRPPTVAEYDAIEARGEITPDDIRGMLESEGFYARMRSYHHALLRSNITDSVYNNGDSGLVGKGEVGSAYQMTGNPAAGFRGRNGIAADSYIPQAQCDQAIYRQDPHAEPLTRICYDAAGVPLPVSYDYSPSFYVCTALDKTDKTIRSCTDAVSRAAIEEKYLYFCDMQRDGVGVLHPFLCLPDQAKADTKALTREVFDPANRYLIAFENPAPDASTLTRRLDRCTLTLTSPSKGVFKLQPGCLEREGYELVAPPPWDTTGRKEVAVAAIQAQTRVNGAWTNLSCEGTGFMSDRSCGCGKNFRRCESADRSVHNARVASFNLENELIADSVLRRDEPYFNLLSTRRSFVNGTLSALFHDEQAGAYFGATPPAEPAAIPSVPYLDSGSWSEYTRGANHSGVLTTAAFLLRYPTYRARVSFFYEAFLCKTFAPPADATLPDPEDSCNRENNLAKRCGCKYCHATLEPTGAHWGRFSERAATYLDPAKFPRFDPSCRDCALAGSCGPSCTANYVTAAYDGDGASSLGMLKTYLYRSPAEEQNIDAGPRLLVERMLRTGELERCAVHRVWKEFLGRPMTDLEEAMYLESLAGGFAADHHRMKGLIERILMSDAYRRLD